MTDEQKRKLGDLWFVYGHPRSIKGDVGQRTHGNHKYIQRLVEGRPEAAAEFKRYATKKCIAAVDNVLQGK